MIIIMGVSGSGKTTLGKNLSKTTGWPFYDADDFHSIANKKKMLSGFPLTDDDRKLWLDTLSTKISIWSKKGDAILACSSLKEKYRKKFMKMTAINWVVLNGSFNQIKARLSKRKNHFFNPKLLKSQIEAYEPPYYGINLRLSQSLKNKTEIIIKEINNHKKSEIGIIGLGIMGKGIALNLAEKSIKVSVYNRKSKGEEKVVDDFLKRNIQYKNISGYNKIQSFIESLETPRKIWLMIKSGEPVDKLIDEIKPYLEPKDILIDSGNSNYLDTQKREKELKKLNIDFVGCGISGGKDGARNGSSIMFGGSKSAYLNMQSILDLLSLNSKHKKPSHTNIGSDGAGHFIKMVHNGIEYVEMQLISEVYSLVKKFMSNDSISELFNKWNDGSESSYLLAISHKIFKKKEGNKYLIDLILDKAENKGTGIWSSIAALKYGEPSSMISSAVNARFISNMRSKRIDLSNNKPRSKKSSLIDLETLKESYQFARLINHIQGFSLIEKASKSNGWKYNPSEIARVWTQGCIIRSELMENLFSTFKTSKNLLKNKNILKKLQKLEESTSKLIRHGLDNKIPLDTYSNSYNYWLSICTESSPANLIQAQRDFFGSHGYSRIDKGLNETFNSNWENK